MKIHSLRSSISIAIRRVTPLAIASCVAVLAACETPPDRYLGGLIDEPASPADPSPAAVTEPFGGPADEFVGHWVGTAQDPLALEGDDGTFAFDSGATQITLDLERGLPEETGSLITGTITFGAPRALPPLDPDVGYPSDAHYERLGYFEQTAEAAAGYPGPLPPYEGFAYHGAENGGGNEIDNYVLPEDRGLADGVLRFELDTEEVLTPWCELQQPQPMYEGQFGCVKGDSWSADDNGMCSVGFSDPPPELVAFVEAQGVSVDFENVDCGKLFLCRNNRCQCDESGCRGRAFEGSSAVLNLRREDEGLVGVFDGLALYNVRGLTVPPGPVHFTRAP